MKAKEFELSFRNPEVRMYAAIILPGIVIGLLIIIFSNSEFQFTYAWIVQAVSLLIFYCWRFFYKRKKVSNNS
ncbi:hypothetical protein DV702_13805 [Sporosarcina sp. PTS2304]|uniref:hypothetical protein n=1 Tax=Sporosarcina sp. PTS2304 TaxID=2283194 RepID=UPI000E0DA2C9|nr:hypothetical protein [Sporosarcina sp. PTS2304]AXI00698.1 hypothetical protein DV702_13805 [Sporosarcina sp. PTS2304]